VQARQHDASDSGTWQKVEAWSICVPAAIAFGETGLPFTVAVKPVYLPSSHWKVNNMCANIIFAGYIKGSPFAVPMGIWV
jgi:hypothetical protein